MNKTPDEPFEICGTPVPRGTRKRIEIPVTKLFDYTGISVPVMVVRGKQDGPVLFVSAAIHGDEINGVEVVKRLLASRRIGKNMKGTLIAVPIVNVIGFNNNSRYLPDRRDLNRCFPGLSKGSLGGQIANTFMKEIVAKSTHGIDLHTGAIHRTNLPQIRACLDDEETNRLAHSFGVPVIINSTIRDGSLRQAAAERGIPMLLFEGGEALRYEEKVIQTGLMGILAVMESIGMIKGRERRRKSSQKETFVARSSYWVRAPHSGSLRIRKKVGTLVKKGEILGELSDPYGGDKILVKAQRTGIIIGKTMIPLVNNGDALFHIATFEDSGAVEEQLEVFEENLEQEYEE
ncbi:succinylglutamate desuccinylase/aspartoacylase family protein [Emcibacter sp.]|uniref:succinylglutamate desuccinylase/aspartoacylase family protein n=1 Tax=Emcibacter sp. TaxID=1979954 RepID=UPI003A8E569C